MPRIVNESRELGVPKSEIVLGCQFPDIRKLTEFAMAEI
ncbi:element excision factor XisI family protein [Dapis sp. BLCC M229]